MTDEPAQDLATTTPGELTPAAEAELVQGALASIQGERVQLPLLKLTQQLSAEVTSGEAKSGEFVNTLTDANYGDETAIIIASTAKGRFYAPEDSDAVYVAQDTDVVPPNWPEEMVGQRFDSLPEAEETYKERVNAGEIEWGRGPAIRTTYNYVGFVPDDPDVPVRLSLQRSSKPAADKINTILRFALAAPWSSAITLKAAEQRDRQDRPYFVVRASKGRTATPEERQNAITLYQQVSARGVEASGDEDLHAQRRAAASNPDDLDIT